jgi:hypothetical protein
MLDAGCSILDVIVRPGKQAVTISKKQVAVFE